MELSAADWALVDCVTSKESSHVSLDNKISQCNKFQCLHMAKHPATTSVTEAVVNVTCCWMMQLGLSDGFKRHHLSLSTANWDMMGGVKNAVSMLLIEVAEVVQEETLRIFRISKKLKNSISRTEKLALSLNTHTCSEVMLVLALLYNATYKN